MNKTILVLCLTSSVFLLSTQSHSQQYSPIPVETVEGTDADAIIKANEDGVVSATKDGVAIGGYDPVAFFEQNAAVVGEPEYSCGYLGKTWHFTSEENRDKFLASPESFTPQFGGFCAHSLNRGEVVEADPEAFLVRDDKLYFYAEDSLRDRELRRSDIDFGDLNNKRKANWSEYKLGF